jgi:4-hydroxybenzoate polyprenyltransferase
MRHIEQRQAIAGFPAALRVLRASQWLHFAVLPLAGMDRATLASPAGLARGAVAALAASLALGYAYGVNALGDRASDVSAAKNPLAGVARVPADTKIVVASAAVGALSISMLLGPAALVLVLSSLVAGTVYSVGPRLKAWPVVGALFNTAIFTPLLALATPEGAAPPPARAVLCATFVGLILQSQLLHEAADADEDAAGGVLTTARLLGSRWTRALTVALAAPFTLLAVALAPRPWVGWAAAVALAGGAAAALFERDWAEARRLHRRVAALGGALLFSAGLLA